MKRLLTAIFCSGIFISHAQFKADNVKYKTVFPEELCKTLQANPGYVLLDVRSDGEFYDTTSSSPALNIGHLQNALHINITQLPQRWKELTEYKDKPLFIYCSHSQRSRRASRLLADSGFTNVYNINGGLTNFYDEGIQSDPCAGFIIESSVPYKIVSPKSLLDAKTQKSYYIIDLRSDSIFGGIGNERSKTEGRFCDAINIPFEKFMNSEAMSFKKPVLLVDEFGDESAKAANMLYNKGIKNVSILFGGMDGWKYYVVNNRRPKEVYDCNQPSGYSIISGDQFTQIMKTKDAPIVIDVRSKEEFSNTSKNYWQNIGQVKTAINIPAGEIKNSALLPSSKNQNIVVYGFNSQPEIFESAKALKDIGYKNVSVLHGGIWRLRWVSHNIKDKMYLNDLVINVPAENE
jgi:rhodanese-related sulfurtransferase